MTAIDRAANLMIAAEKRGCETPTEGMIADAIIEAEGDMSTECQALLLQYGFTEAAATLERWWERRMSAEQDT